MAGDGPVVVLDAALEVFLEVRRDPRIQLEQATQAAQAFLEALGVDLTRPGMKDTPARMARAYAELFSPRPFRATHFPNGEHYDRWCWPNRSRSHRSVSTTCRHSAASPTWATCRATGSWGAVQARPAGRALRRRVTDAGAAHQADRRVAKSLRQ